MRIVIATGNRGKLAEFSTLFKGFAGEICAGLVTGKADRADAGPAGVEIVSQRQLGIPEADETGLSFVENAILKARNAARHAGLPAIADDSGLEVDALDGAPGIYSSRYAGPDAGDRANIEKLLDDLGEVPEQQRGARFQCVIVLMRHAADPTPLICQGTWEGRVLFEPRGSNGFGYDPIFYVAAHACASAELPPEIKNRISHRGQALSKLLQALSAPGRAQPA